MDALPTLLEKHGSGAQRQLAGRSEAQWRETSTFAAASRAYWPRSRRAAELFRVRLQPVAAAGARPKAVRSQLVASRRSRSSRRHRLLRSSLLFATVSRCQGGCSEPVVDLPSMIAQCSSRCRIYLNSRSTASCRLVAHASVKWSRARSHLPLTLGIECSITRWTHPWRGGILTENQLRSSCSELSYWPDTDREAGGQFSVLAGRPSDGTPLPFVGGLGSEDNG
jgi:hypothetical protein